ncbi:amidohydrolase family protein [Nocardiopsis mangrovi]|uniref:Amidohydrolase family protein n=1 Tax=Nocardiopsis mangrovi TaxID=1179818 RepID=A0ABV9DV43_9ACTN
MDAADRGVPIPAESLALAREALDAHRAGSARTVDAGVKVAMGTDSPPYGTPPANELDELPPMTRASSMPPEGAWRAATANAAALLRRDGLGTIAPGRIAVLVVVDGRRDDLRGLRDRIRRVTIGGRRVR